MKVRSDRLPQNNFEVSNIRDNICDVVFFDASNYVEEIIENEKSYEYQMYTITIPYRTDLETDISNNYDKWYNYAKDKEHDTLASEIRSARDKLLQDSDKEMLIDRLDVDSIDAIKNSAWAKYRQELRDITKQSGFPYDVIFPEKPKE